jgi:DNA-binding FadR family transcriptional regulator
MAHDAAVPSGRQERAEVLGLAEDRSGTPPFVDTGGKRGRVKADTIAVEIERAIMAREHVHGEVVGSEEALANRFSVSRPIMREAFRLLELSGVASVRRGPGGGLVVEEPNADPVVAAAQRFLQYRGVGPGDVVPARIALEALCVEELVGCLDESKISQLRFALEEEERAGPAIVGGQGLGEHIHLLIADLSGNVVFGLFVPVLTRLSSQAIHLPEADWPARAAESHSAHVAIVDAIVRGDVGLAQHRLRRHLNAMSVYLGDSDAT